MLDLPLKKFNKFYCHLKAFVIDNKKSLDPLFLFCILRVFLNNLYSFSMKSRVQSLLVKIRCNKEFRNALCNVMFLNSTKTKFLVSLLKCDKLLLRNAEHRSDTSLNYFISG